MSEKYFELPYPISINRYWKPKPGGNGMYKTTEAIAYAWQVRAACDLPEPFVDDVSVTVELYRPRKAGDLDNYLKLMLDALQGIAYISDAQIVEIHAMRLDDRDNPRVTVKIKEVVT